MGLPSIISTEDNNTIETTYIAVGTTAEYAHDLYLAKIKQIEALKYECNLLVDKYHSEMCRARIPPWFQEAFLDNLFSKDKDIAEAARKHFLSLSFSDEFLGKYEVQFVDHTRHGYMKTAVSIIFGIGDFLYSVEIPIPKNIVIEKEKVSLMGNVKFRADKIHKSQRDSFVKGWEAIQFPTYDWKACFNAIEEDAKKMHKEGDGR